MTLTMTSIIRLILLTRRPLMLNNRRKVTPNLLATITVWQHRDSNSSRQHSEFQTRLPSKKHKFYFSIVRTLRACGNLKIWTSSKTSYPGNPRLRDWPLSNSWPPTWTARVSSTTSAWSTWLASTRTETSRALTSCSVRKIEMSFPCGYY